ncbi:MAG: N-acyl homoserine lactonase family protein [Candidatus Binataceae bacterium]
MKTSAAVILALILAAVAISGVVNVATAATPDVELWRLDCGEFHDFDIGGLSDGSAYQGRKKTLANSCYLIRHDSQYMIWDTGFPKTVILKPNPPGLPWGLTMRATLIEQLARLSVKPEQILIIGISHYHFDHTGQASDFPKARLLIGREDWDAIVQKKPGTMPPRGMAGGFYPWLALGASVEPITGDKDIFDDGSVIMLRTPGHTAGHHSLLVRLPKSGAVILSGDLWHISDQLSDNGVPTITVNRADLLASRDRILTIAAHLKANIIIQHEPSDVSKLPAFPASAR